MSQSSMVFIWLLTALTGLSACKSASPSSGALRSEESLTETLVAPTLRLADLKTKQIDEWRQLFADGRASADLIPSIDRPEMIVRGEGYPLIFTTFPQLNTYANMIWNGKNLETHDGVTSLKNQFVAGTGINSVRIFNALVKTDANSRLADGKPVILLDYSIAAVPGIEAIRDELRLVSDGYTRTADGKKMRHRLFLGPTFLDPERTTNIISRQLATVWRTRPILFFALEFNEPADPAEAEVDHDTLESLCRMGPWRVRTKLICDMTRLAPGCVASLADCNPPPETIQPSSYEGQEAWLNLQNALPENLHLAADNMPREDHFQWHGHNVHLDRFERPHAKARVILLHGVGTNGRQMSMIAGGPLAKAGFDTVALDLPTYGVTTVNRNVTVRYDDWVDLVSDFINAEIARDGKPVVLYGLSAGGMLAYHAAAKNTHVAGIVGMTFLDQRDQTIRDRTFSSVFMARVGTEGVSLLAHTLLGGIEIPVASVGKMETLVNDPEALRIMMADGTSAGNWASIKFMDSYINYQPSIEPQDFSICPILLTQPEKDGWTPLDLSERFLNKITRVRKTIKILGNAGHYPIEQPGQTQMITEMTAFINQLQPVRDAR